MAETILTRRQQQVWRLIQRLIREGGAPPTIRELRDALRLKSLRGVTVHLDALVRKGYIRRSRQARGIRLVQNQVFEIQPFSMPVLGRIAAGSPLLAEQNVEERLTVDPRWVPGPRCFSVRVHGDSMIGSGISSGDYVVIRPQSEAQNGEIVAVLVDGEATVKRLYRERRGRLRLQPDNPEMKPMFVEPKLQSVRILGKVVGLFRKL